MFGVGGQPEWNFFEHDWNTWVPRNDSPALVAIGCKFSTATKFIGNVGVSDFAKVDA